MTDVAKLYIGNLSSRTVYRDLEEAFSKFGRIRSVEMKRRFAFVDFAHKNDAENAIHSMDGKDLDGNKLVVEWTKGKPRNGRSGSPRYDSRRRSRPGTGRRPPERSDYRIAVSNLPDRCHWSELKDHFRQVGEVVFGDVVGTRGVIEFKYREDMESAIKELDGVKWRGYALQVEKDLRSRDDRRDRGGSRRNTRRSRSRSYSSRSRSYSPRSRSTSADRRDKRKSRNSSRSPSETKPKERERDRDSKSPPESPRDRKRKGSESPRDSKKRRYDSHSPTPTKEGGGGGASNNNGPSSPKDKGEQN
jgi:arginine/serine-rich splicing factor 4/5/6